MKFVGLALLSTVAAAAATPDYGNDKPCLDSYGTQTQEALMQRYNTLDTNIVVARGSENMHFPTQTQNKTPEAIPDKHTQKRTDSSTPGTQIMSPWRQVVGGIAVAVLVAVV